MRAGYVPCRVEMMEAVGGKGLFVEDPKDLKDALAEAMNHRGPRPRQRCALAGLGTRKSATRHARGRSVRGGLSRIRANSHPADFLRVVRLLGITSR
jgi:hypothetical protein